MPDSHPIRKGSPFIVGRPLHADEPIFGRNKILQQASDHLLKYESVNIVGERRMGKTSVLNHLLGNQARSLPALPDQPSLILARVDLQGAQDEAHFYGVALRELIEKLPDEITHPLSSLYNRLQSQPTSTFDEFDAKLRYFAALKMRPVLLVDEFNALLDESSRANFPYPGFYNGLSSLLTANVLAMVVFSQAALGSYFVDPRLPKNMTSTFPRYFTPYSLERLSVGEADALLLQPSDPKLSIEIAAKARNWANGHPCHLQAAGQAWYEGLKDSDNEKHVYARFQELTGQNCMDGTGKPQTSSPEFSLFAFILAPFKLIFWRLPLFVGRVTRWFGRSLDEMATWVLGFGIILIIIFLVFQIITPQQAYDFLKSKLGLP
jgi:hypothetical protein